MNLIIVSLLGVLSSNAMQKQVYRPDQLSAQERIALSEGTKRLERPLVIENSIEVFCDVNALEGKKELEAALAYQKKQNRLNALKRFFCCCF